MESDDGCSVSWCERLYKVEYYVLPTKGQRGATIALLVVNLFMLLRDKTNS